MWIDKLRFNVPITIIIAIIFSVVGGTAATWAWKSDVDHKIVRNEENITENEEMICELKKIQEKIAERQVRSEAASEAMFSRINTNLEWIIDSLTDLKKERGL